MPRVIVRQYRPEDFDYGQPFARGVAEAGQALGRGIQASGEARDKRDREEKDYQIQLQKAEAATLREQRMAAEYEERATSREADRAAVVEGLEKLGAEKAGAEWQKGVQEALRSPGGVLGPFGMLNPRKIAGSARGAMEAQKQMLGDVEQAKRMTPSAARRFLTDRTEERKLELVTRAYEEETADLQKALQDGAFEDPLAIFASAGSGKVQPPSETAMRRAEDFGKALRQALQDKKMPGETSKRLQEVYDQHRKIRQRAVGWKKADVDAVEMLDTFQQLAAKVENPELRDPLLGKLAEARGEWARTEYPSFRVANEPADTLGKLQALIFDAQALQGSVEPTATERNAKIQEDYIRAVGGTRGPIPSAPPAKRGRSSPERQRQTQAAPAPSAPAKRQPKGGKRTDVQALENYVVEHAQDALRAGSREERVTAIERMVDGAVRTFGVNRDDPRVRRVIRQALSKAFEG